MNRFKWGLILPIVMITGCHMTVDVVGKLGADEALSGSLTHYDDGGTIELTGNPGTHCIGNFTYRRRDEGVEGSGTMLCSDRRSGPLHFLINGMKHGAGSGLIGGQQFTIRF